MALVLVVDDIPQVRRFLARIIERMGHACAEASDGAEGLELARRVKPALVISDLMMPTMDGFEFVRRLRADPELFATPVMLVSAAYHHTEAANLAAGLNIARLLVKPLLLEDTVDAVRACIGGEGGAPAPEPAARGTLESLAAGPHGEGLRLVGIIALDEELARAAEPAAVLETLCRSARDLLGARAVLAVVCAPEGGQYRHAATAGWAAGPASVITGQYPAGGPLRALLDGAVPALRLRGAPLEPLAPHWPAGTARSSCLGVRLSSTAFPTGALVLLDALAGGWSLADEELAALLAARGGLAYEKSMLLVEAQQRAHDLAAEVLMRRSAETRLQALSQRLVQVQEEERRRLARELHDEFGQLLTGFKLKLEAVAGHAPPAVAEQLAGVLADARELIGRTRDLSLDLRPSLLDDLGLQPALEWHVERFHRQTGIAVAVDLAGLGRRLPPDLEVAAYRIVQEALTNVARHARASSAELRVSAVDGTLVVQVQDRGVGFDPGLPPADPTSSGLTGMAERAAALGGRLVVRAATGGGTCITATLPFARSEDR